MEIWYVCMENGGCDDEVVDAGLFEMWLEAFVLRRWGIVVLEDG